MWWAFLTGSVCAGYVMVKYVDHPLEPTAKELQHEVRSAVSLMTTTVTKGIEQEQQKNNTSRKTDRETREMDVVSSSTRRTVPY